MKCTKCMDGSITNLDENICEIPCEKGEYYIEITGGGGGGGGGDNKNEECFPCTEICDNC